MIIKELFAKLGLDIDTSGFEKGDMLIGGLKMGLAAVGAALVAAGTGITHMVMETAAAGKEFYLLAQKTGMATGDLQELAYAASRVGVDLEGTSHGLIHLTKHMAAARDGNEEATKAFGKVGVKVQDAGGHLRDAGDVLEDLAEHFATMPDGADKTALSLQLFGKSGAAMIPLLNKGRDGIDALRASAREMGIVLDDDAIQKSLELRSAMGDLKANTMALQYAIAVPLMGTVGTYVKALGEWIKGNRDLTRQRIEKVVGVIKVALMLALVPLKVMATVLGFVIDNWKLLAVILSSVVFAALVVNAAQVIAIAQGYIAAGVAGVVAGVKTAAAWVLANAPLLIMTGIFVLLILLIDDVVTAVNGGKSVLGEWLNEWKDDSPGDAWWLRDLKSLGYLMLHMGPVFDFWKGEVGKLWDWMKEGFANTWDDIVVGVKSLFGIHDDRNDKKRAKKAHYAMGYMSDQSATLGAGEWKQNGNGENMWYPFSTVGDAADSSASARAWEQRSQFQVTQQIVGAPGQSPGEVAGEAVNQFSEWHQGVLESAQSEM